MEQLSTTQLPMDCTPDLQPFETGKYHYIQFPKGKVSVSEITQKVRLVGEQTVCSFAMMKRMYTVDFLFQVEAF